MNELERIVRESEALAAEASPYLLATVVRVSGSSYRRPGARMLVAGDRWLAGCVSGGCLEGDVMMRGAHRARDGAVVVTYDSQTEDGEPYGLGCGGIVDVLLEYVAPGARNDALAFAAACFAGETSGTLVTVIRASDRVPLGARLAAGPEVALAHPVADPAARRILDELARGAAGVYEVPALGISALVEHVAPSPQLFVLGSGHDAAPLVPLAKSVGFRVTVADHAVRERSRVIAADRVVSTGGDPARVAALVAEAAEPYVVIMHHQVAADRAALAMALASKARYIGVLGPAKRTRDQLVELGRMTQDQHLLDVDPRLHAPIGLDLGAETPEQIALAIVAEIQAVARRARGGMLRDRTRALHADVATIVLAAGGSRRLGRPKQLVELEGVPLVQRAVRTAVAVRGGPVGVVLGAAREPIAQALGDLRVAHVVNDAWEEGIASSIRAGVRWAQTTQAGALVIVLADQVRLGAEHLAALRDAWLAGAAVAGSRFTADGSLTVGAPAIFDRSRWDELLRLEGDRGAGALLRTPEVVAIDWPDGEVDVDTADDVAALRA